MAQSTTMTNFPAIATRGHRPLKGDEARVMLSGSTVKPSTAAEIDRLMATGDMSRGEVIDHAIDYLVSPKIAARPLSTAARAATNSQSLRVQRVPTPLSSVKSKYIVTKSKN